MDADLILNRARSVLGNDTVYALGAGNFSNQNPQRPLGNKADCSGYVCWCIMKNRKTDHPLYVAANNGWLDTFAIHRDIERATGFFDPLDQGVPGAVVVYPDSNGRHGHIGIVVSASGPGVDGIDEVIHCSSGNYKTTGDAIQITDAAVFQNNSKSLIGWYIGATYPE